MRPSDKNNIKLKKIAQDMGLPFEEVRDAWKSQFEFIRAKTKVLEIPKNLTKEEFDNLKTNFNIPCIGKLYASHYLYNKINENARRRIEEANQNQSGERADSEE